MNERPDQTNLRLKRSLPAVALAATALLLAPASALHAQHNGVEPALEFIDPGDQIFLDGGVTFPAGSDVELSAWIFPTSWQGNNPGLWRDGTTSNGGNFMIFQGASGRPWVRWGGDNILQPGDGYSVPLNEWTQVRYVVRSGDSVEFFTRGPGEEDWVLRHSAEHNVATPDFTLYRYGWQANSGERVVGIHNNIEFRVDDAPFIHWELNEGFGAEIAGDSSDNGHDGEIQGPRWVDTAGRPLKLPGTMPFAHDFGSVRFFNVLDDRILGDYETWVTEDGGSPYTDDDEITITSLPAELEGKLALRTANGEARWVFDEEPTDVEWTFVNAIPDLDFDGSPIDGANTTLADGSGDFQPLDTGGGADEWARRDFANGMVLQAFGPGDSLPANTRELKTTIRNLEPGAEYAVSAMFWHDPSPWTIRAGLEYGNDQYENELYDPAHNAALDASTFTWTDEEILVAEGNRLMKAAFLGNIAANESGEIDVFVHDLPTFSAGMRTWYDGVAVGSEPLERSGDYLAFEVDRDTTVYIVNDPSSEPSWLTSAYSSTGLTVETTAGSFDVWERSVAAGEQVFLPGNAGGSGAMNYWVVLGEGPDAVTEMPLDQFLPLPEAEWSLGSSFWQSATDPEAELHTATLTTEVSNFDPANGFRLTATARVPRLQEAGDNSYGLVLLGSEQDAFIHAEWLPRTSGGDSLLRLVDSTDGSVLAQESWTGLTPSRVDNNVGLLDDSQVPLETGLPYFTGEVLLADDFEDAAASEAAWTSGGENNLWEAGVPTTGPGEAQSGENVFATGLDEGFQDYTEAWLRSPVIDLTGSQGASLRFWDYHQLDDEPEFHYAAVRVLDANTLDEIEVLERTTGATGAWRFREFVLSGDSVDREIVIEFRLVTDDFSEVEGWYIDDFEIQSEAGIITSMPDRLAPDGRLFGVATDRDDVAADGNDYLTFTVVDNAPGDGNEGVTVYVAWDVRASGLEPDWLTQEFTRTGHFVGVSSEAAFHRLWAREYADGEQVTLGGASAAGPGAAGLPLGTHNYFVLLGDTRSGLETFYTLEASGSWADEQWTLDFTLTDADGTNQTVQATVSDPLEDRNEFGVAARHPDPEFENENGEDAPSTPVWETASLAMDFFEAPDLLTFEQWRDGVFSQPQIDAGLADPDAAPAGDGVANIIKYALDLPPLEPAVAADLPRLEPDPDSPLILVYRERTDIDRNQIEYRPEVSEDLVGEGWEGGSGSITELNRQPVDTHLEEVTVRGELPDGTPKGFIRLNVIQHN